MAEQADGVATGTSRRTLLKRGAVVTGTALWAVPAVQTLDLPGLAAQGRTPGSPAPGPGPTPTGTVQGTVTNASNGNPIVGALVTVQGTGLSDTTDASGFYQITGAPSGNRTLQASAAGFASATAAVNIPAGGTENENFALSALGSVRAVLTWGTIPADLDIHMSGPDGDPGSGRFHVYFGDLTHDDYVSLDHDDQSGEGPETITVSVSPSHSGQFVAGDYHVWIHDWTNRNNSTDQWDVSDAKVRFFDQTSQKAEFDVLNATGNDDLHIWLVANFTLDAAGNMTVTSVQTFSAGTSGSVF